MLKNEQYTLELEKQKILDHIEVAKKAGDDTKELKAQLQMKIQELDARLIRSLSQIKIRKQSKIPFLSLKKRLNLKNILQTILKKNFQFLFWKENGRMIAYLMKLNFMKRA
ncbi:hypothetical protein ABE173_15245 [Bacillus velezensis]|uniref:hypothetical protein n=1 Tax=Bacillus velezensis TaxID=492670 RepID=UPI001F1DD1F1|nr:hypothetical protein [Bacillus velezensis]